MFGWIASSLCTLILVPQIIKALQTKHTDDLSMSMLVLSVSGNAFWAAHASLTQNIPVCWCQLNCVDEYPADNI